PDREVEVLVDQHEGRADRHDAELGGIAQGRRDRGGIAPEARGEVEPDEGEQDHHGEPAELPGPDEQAEPPHGRLTVAMVEEAPLPRCGRGVFWTITGSRTR